jgi:hypothetical protein
VAWRGVAWRGVAWRGVAWRGVAWRGVAWRGVAWRGTALALRGCGWNRAVHESVVLPKADARLELLVKCQEINEALSEAGIDLGCEQSYVD